MTDPLYVYFIEGYEGPVMTSELRPGLLFDTTPDNRLIGIEILEYARASAAGVTLRSEPLDEGLHRLLMPPHPGEVYNSSALCSCGEWQYDADSFLALTGAYGDVLRDHARHVVQGTSRRVLDEGLREALRLYHAQHVDECSCEACDAYDEATDEVALAAKEPPARLAGKEPAPTFDPDIWEPKP